MNETRLILNRNSHRPWPLPAGPWQFYQEWNAVIFLHWEIPFDVLRRQIPEKMQPDNFDGKYYVSLVAFTMQKVRPKNLPAVPFISDFYEVNFRTYVNNGNKKGVYFFSIEAGKRISAFISKTLSCLPYEKASISRSAGRYKSDNRKKNFHLDLEYTVKEKILAKSDLDKWLTERYCLYQDHQQSIYRYEVHHQEWELNEMKIQRLEQNYRVEELNLSGKEPDLVHYSAGVKVLTWPKQKIH